MKLEIGADLNEWLRKLIHSRKFRDNHQNKVVNDGRKFLGEKDVNATKNDTQASRENGDLVKKVSAFRVRGPRIYWTISLGRLIDLGKLLEEVSAASPIFRAFSTLKFISTVLQLLSSEFPAVIGESPE